MSADTMSQVSPEKKRKHKNKDHTPSKKRKHAVSDDVDATLPDAVSSPTTPKAPKPTVTAETTTVKSDPGSPFRLVTSTLYLPLSPISISPTHAQASLVTEHLAPLLLTYYPPFKGIVLAYSNASISSTPPAPGQVNTGDDSSDIPKPLTLALTANEYGVLYLYLTATFLVFSPQKGQILEGWVNVQSEGFLGAIAYNLFSVGIERKRVPKSWKWTPPGADDDDTASDSGSSKSRKKGYVSATSGDEDDSGNNKNDKLEFNPEKELFTPLPKAVTRKPIPTDNTLENGQDDEDDEDDPNATGYFQSVSGHRVRGTIRFRVRDVDVIPGADPDRGFLSIEGTMLTPEEEARLDEQERSGHFLPHRHRDPTAMSGGIAQTQPTQPTQPDVAEITLAETPNSKEEKKKEKKKSKEKHKSKPKE
jgi:DNA-directed RNA polymerase I subunit RPA43